MKETLVIGTRGSALALWQAEFVRDALRKKFPSLRVERRIIKTTGDKILDSPLSTIGDKGLFTKEIERALLAGAVDLAVHSLKDLPTQSPPGLAIAAITKREDVRDVFISNRWKTIFDIPEGGTVATGSLRRRAQILHIRPDLRILDIRGNVQSRLAKLDASDWDGMLLAFAGVKRLGLEGRIAQILPVELMLPAVGQGALGIQIREEDARTRRYARALDHAATRACALAERALLRTLEGGCQIPIGAHAVMAKGRIRLRAVVGNLDGTLLLDAAGTSLPANAERLGIRIGRRLFEGGAKEILEEIRRHG